MTDASGHGASCHGWDLYFEGLSETPLRAGSPAVLRFLSEHFSQWPFEVVKSARQEKALLTLEEAGTGFCSRSRDGAQTTFSTAAEMLCDTGIDLAEAFVRRTPGMQCLHCSAVRLKGRLAVFPNVNRAGKSLLAANLLLQGGHIFADDLLAVTEEGEGMSFGLPPRLRLPLPSSSSRLSDELSRRAGLTDGHYHFIYAGKEGLASFGERLPLGALILPRRIAGASLQLHRLAPAAALAVMAYQFQMETGQAERVFTLAKRLCDCLPLWVLDYDSPEEAAEYLMREAEEVFSLPSEKEPVLNDAAFLAASDRIRTKGRRSSFPRSLYVRWRRADGVIAHEVGQTVYLIPEAGDDIFCLDGIGPAIWALLATPLSVGEAAGLLAEVFPQIGRARIEKDLLGFFHTLFGRGLLERDGC